MLKQARSEPFSLTGLCTKLIQIRIPVDQDKNLGYQLSC
jgi:hypothetical protein